MRMFQQEEFATALKKEWRSRLTLMQPTVTNTGGLARRPKNLGGAAPWLVAVLRGAAGSLRYAMDNGVPRWQSHS